MAGLLKKVLISEFGLRLQEKCFPSRYRDPENTALINNAMERFRTCDNKKETTRMQREIQVCKKYWKCYPHHYFTNNLYMADKEVTDDELINYIPHFFWFNLFLPYYSSPQFNIIAENKIIIGQFFRALKIPQPETLCLIMNGHTYSSGMNRLTGDQVQQELTGVNSEKLFVKPAEGWGGKEIHIFHKAGPGHFVDQDNVVFDHFFLKSLGKDQDYIVQHGVTQCRELSEIYPESVNTFRIITENKNGVARVVCAMLRMGRGHKEIDNISSGGICVNIDILSGKSGDYAMSNAEEKIVRHPDSGIAFHDITISQWDEIRKFAMTAAGKMPFLPYLGWDIALTPRGPVAIEINRTPGLAVIETLSGGMREGFGIHDPDFYWKNLGKEQNNRPDNMLK
jgi:hypothetical protein